MVRDGHNTYLQELEDWELQMVAMGKINLISEKTKQKFDWDLKIRKMYFKSLS